MLDIFNKLQYFFEDCYRRINVREYAKLMKISPPTASKMLSEFQNEGLLKKEIDKGYHLFYANKENQQFIGLSRLAVIEGYALNTVSITGVTVDTSLNLTTLTSLDNFFDSVYLNEQVVVVKETNEYSNYRKL